MSRHDSYDMPGHTRSDSCYQESAVTTDPAGSSAKGSSAGSIAISPNTLPSYQQLHGASPLQHSETYSPTPVCSAELSRRDGLFVHHFAQHLAAWLDCTDASRHFTLNMAILARTSPILLNAVVSFAARHMRCDMAADSAQQRCVELLIPHLSCDGVGSDEAVLCAIVILRVCEQLSGK